MWEHSLWIDLVAELVDVWRESKARNVVDDIAFRKWFLIRPSALWMLMYVLV